MTQHRTIIVETEGRLWLLRDRLDDHDEHVEFTDLDGVIWVDRPTDLAIFEWKGEMYEIQGYDRANKRWWVELYTPPVLERMASGDSSDPRGQATPWRRS